MAGRRFERLLVLAFHEFRGSCAAWRCICDCGAESIVSGKDLRLGRTKSCGCLARKNRGVPALELTGQRFGRLRVVERAENRGHHVRWRCICDCGAESIVGVDQLRSGDTQSCGCLHREVSSRIGKRYISHATASLVKHGATRNGRVTPEYSSWAGMVARCENPRHIGFERYGARGISVCPRWRGSFEAFLEDMGSRPVGCSIDRIDNDSNYEPGNCRWATHKEQRANQRRAMAVA